MHRKIEEIVPNFVEVASVEEANQMDLGVYRLLAYSDRRGIYIFQLRSRKVE